MTYNITNEQLTEIWRRYINDKSLFLSRKFGQYLHDKTIPAGYCWPRLYYANTEAYDMVWNHINKAPTNELRKVQ